RPAAADPAARARARLRGQPRRRNLRDRRRRRGHPPRDRDARRVPGRAARDAVRRRLAARGREGRRDRTDEPHLRPRRGRRRGAAHRARGRPGRGGALAGGDRRRARRFSARLRRAARVPRGGRSRRRIRRGRACADGPDRGALAGARPRARAHDGRLAARGDPARGRRARAVRGDRARARDRARGRDPVPRRAEPRPRLLHRQPLEPDLDPLAPADGVRARRPRARRRRRPPHAQRAARPCPANRRALMAVTVAEPVSAPAILCENLVKIYKVADLEVVALQGLDLSVDAGELVAIVGASGSGKSTLQNILGGVDTPTAGRVEVAGLDLAALSEGERTLYRRRVVGFVWQQTSRNLLPYLTAAENVELPMTLEGVGRRERRGRVRALLELVGLGTRAKHRPDALSGGEQQRVAVAIALANRPSVLLADEPTGELDTESSAHLFETRQAVSRELGVTVVVLTHDPFVSEQVERTIGIRDG